MNYKYIEEKLESIKKETIDFVPRLIVSIIIFILFYVIASWVKNTIMGGKKKNKKMDSEQISLLNSIVNPESNQLEPNKFSNNLVFYQVGWIGYYSVITIGIIFALVNLGFDVGAILTVLATLGLALGLALQETIKNIISGVYLAITNPFGLTDLISIKSLGNINPVIGRVIDFNLYFTSIIDSKTNQITTVPNSIIQNNLITNLSRTL